MQAVRFPLSSPFAPLSALRRRALGALMGGLLVFSAISDGTKS